MKAAKIQNKDKTLALKDREYPRNLRYIFDPPDRIFVRGELWEQDALAIAVVGSRRASYYGLRNAEKLSAELAARGITIVSGLARGVDSAAHRGALKAGGRTIAVMGSGLDVMYPPENSALAERIISNGAMISEFLKDTPPHRMNFPRRNRIISGLSLGVVVIEAARRSGALITADFALEQGRDVFALPGQVDSFTSQGTHHLLKQGAKLVDSVDDILQEIQPLLVYDQKSADREDRNSGEGLSVEESKVLARISRQPRYIDEIVEKSDLRFGQVCKCLLALQQKRLVKEQPGKIFIVN